MLKVLMMDAIAHFRECILLNASLLVSFIAAICYLKLSGGNADKKVRSFLVYGSAVVILLLLPVSASVLRIAVGTYYDAPDMWTVMPLIPFGAVMFAALSGEMASGLKKEKKGTVVLFCILIAAAILMCGSLGTPRQQTSGRPENAGIVERALCETIFEKKLLGGGEQVVFAPDDIIASLHTGYGNAQTLYGRDMWDGRLTKNRYGWYEPELVSLHDDMTRIMNGDISLAPDVCRRAFDHGATVVVMPGWCDLAGIKNAGFETLMFGGDTFDGDSQQQVPSYGYIIVTEESFIYTDFVPGA